MRKPTRNRLLSSMLIAAGLGLSPNAPAHLDDKQPMQSYRQSYFALVGMNFGPIAAMLKGEIPWDDARLQTFASDLATLAAIDVSPAFRVGTDKGRTRAKPGIWDNPDDFQAKLGDLREAIAGLKRAADGGDRQAIAEATTATGEACKSCHDEYKSKDYLY